MYLIAVEHRITGQSDFQLNYYDTVDIRFSYERVDIIHTDRIKCEEIKNIFSNCVLKLFSQCIYNSTVNNMYDTEDTKFEINPINKPV